MFPIQNGSMWEMDLVAITFKIMDISLPPFERYPSVMTDGRLIFVVAGFNKSSQFPNKDSLKLTQLPWLPPLFTWIIGQASFGHRLVPMHRLSRGYTASEEE